MMKLTVIWVFCVLVLVNIFAHEHSHGEHHSRQNDHRLKHHEIKARHSVGHDHLKEHHAKEHLRHHAHVKHAHLKHRDNDQDHKNVTTEQNSTTSAPNTTTSDHDNSTSDHSVTTEVNNVSTSENNGTNDPMTGNHGCLVLNLNTSSGTGDVSNPLSGVGLLINYRIQIVVLISDRRKEAVLFDYQSRRGVSLTNISARNITEFLSNLPSLSSLLQGGGHNATFNLSSIPANTSREIQQILKGLNSDYHSFASFLNETFSLSSVLQHLPKAASDFQGQIPGDLNSVLDRLRRIGCFLGQIGNRLGNNSLNLESLLNQNSGLGVFSSIVKQLGGNSSQVLQPALQSAETFLSVISALGRNNPFDLFVRAFSQVVQASSGNSSPQNLINSLIQLYGNGGNLSSIPQQWSSIFRNFISTVHNQTGGNTFPGLDILQQLANRNFSINGNNFTSTFDILRNANSSSPIDSIVQVLFSLSSQFSPQVTIPSLISQLISLANSSSSSGNQTLTNLFPNLNSSSNQGGSEIVQDFLNLIRDEMKLYVDGASLFGSVPSTFLRVILCSVNSAVSRSSGGNLSLLPLLGSNIGLQILQQGAQQFAHFLPNGAGGPFSFFASIPGTFLSGASSFAHIATSIGSNIAHAFGNFGQLGGAGKSHRHLHGKERGHGIH